VISQERMRVPHRALTFYVNCARAIKHALNYGIVPPLTLNGALSAFSTGKYLDRASIRFEDYSALLHQIVWSLQHWKARVTEECPVQDLQFGPTLCKQYN